jgi:modulator of FtsH protease HflC
MKEYGGLGILAAIIVALFLVVSSTFEVNQTEQALVLRFGEPVGGRGLVSDPGLHFKIPFIETVILRSNKILSLESPNQEVLASDNTRIQVDAFLRYRIVDLLKFYQSVQTVERADIQLGYILNSSIRRVLGNAGLPQIVRYGRQSLMDEIRDEVNKESEPFGIDAIDVRIRRADLPEQISEQVYQRMNSERAREAASYRAQGQQEAATIRAQADREVVVTIGNAQQQADTLRGEGDAQRNKIFAEAYGRDPDFFAFYRLMTAYADALATRRTRLVLTPSLANEFFRFFKSPAGTPVGPLRPNEAPAGEPSAER